MDHKCFNCLLKRRRKWPNTRRPYLSDVANAPFVIDGTYFCIDCAWEMTSEDYLLKELNRRSKI